MQKRIRVTVLGAMGWMPSQGCLTCCYCVEYQDFLLIFDAGNGISRLAEPHGQKLIQNYNKIIIFLSHYHLDHISGLIFLPQFLAGKKVIVAGPGQSVYGKGVVEILGDLISPPYFSLPISNFPFQLEYHDLIPGASQIEGLPVEIMLQDHSDPSIALKIDNTICYCTDTAPAEKTIKFAKKSRLLMHEVWLDVQGFKDADQKTLASHSGVQWVAGAANRAEVTTLLLIHLNPEYSLTRLKKMEQKASSIFTNSILALDGKEINL